MDTKAYIASGVIERFALGQASCYEADELVYHAKQYPEVRRALDEALDAVDVLAEASATKAPVSLKEKAMAAVAAEAARGDGVSRTVSMRPSAEGQTRPVEGPKDAGRGRVRFLQTAVSLAAALVLLAGAAAWWLNTENKRLRDDQMVQTERLDRLGAETGEMRASLDRTQSELALLRDNNTRRVPLLAVGPDAGARVDVYWNPERGEAFYDVLALSEPPAGKQYQLWAIVNGVPQDMGVLPLAASAQDLRSFPFVSQPQAFAITLEPAGGSVSPSLDQMVVLGNVTA